MSKLEAIAEHIATRAKAYAGAAVAALGGIDLTVVPQPYAKDIAYALPVLVFISVFKVPNRREILDADVEAASQAFDAIKAAGAPAADQPHPPADDPVLTPSSPLPSDPSIAPLP